MQCSVKRIFTLLFVIVCGLSLLLLAASLASRQAGTDVERAYESRYRSYLLADELRQSSDELTRLARTYVVSGDPMWEQQYLEVIDIRNGRKPRPQSYERIYWDFRAAGQESPRPHGEAVALAELMSKAGFTQSRIRQAARGAAQLRWPHQARDGGHEPGQGPA